MRFREVASVARRSARRARDEMLLGLALAFFGAACIAFVLAGLFMALAVALGPVGACFVTGTVSGIAALVLWLVTSPSTDDEGADDRGRREPPPGSNGRGDEEGDAVLHLVRTFAAGLRAGRSAR